MQMTCDCNEVKMAKIEKEGSTSRFPQVCSHSRDSHVACLLLSWLSCCCRTVKVFVLNVLFMQDTDFLGNYLNVHLSLQVKFHCGVHSLPPAALARKRFTAYSTVSSIAQTSTCKVMNMSRSCYLPSLVLWLLIMKRNSEEAVSNVCLINREDALTSPTSYTTSWLIAQTTSPLVIWWTTPACSAANLSCQRAPYGWKGR